MLTPLEDDYIEQAVGNLVSGLVFADESLLRRTMHPNSRIMSYSNGQPQWYTLDEFIETIHCETTAESDFSPFWEGQALQPSTDPGKPGNEYRRSLKVYADCVSINRRYVTAYPQP
ncbi:nuclear transport factor 2 family protein [Pseudomonas sp. DTU_2021_1001937_2_SI_NGA_ILE_001]|uniref:nuclear transport factor 2 family protein n=1 Tax=Pseudomonas sp. DTU_2021_1001937_2_SI_NGA_ILE_001 TaxID=3077589 RepID=UPI0025FED39D|nr:nuclear transport factor 2 family protein [Pseudomonas sp. DTU_2021_1001937_2_SI_NGA_ILE_001]WNW10522.1 nuclear transport factor 2 family protein [Pseudomonas sp. DTU_2021_1001937_2_SI_NGA_ILE_001]